MKIKAIIFDMDGVIINSIPIHYAVWKEVLHKYGIGLDDDLFSQINGMDTPAIAEFMVEKFSLEVHPSQIANEKRMTVNERLKHGVPLTEGAHNTLMILKRLGYHLALGTSSTRNGVELSLGTHMHGLEFDVIVTEDDVKYAKPAPDIYLKCAENMDMKPEECVVVEDAENGIIAAKKAGMKAIAITTTSKREVFERADVKPDLIISKISEINSDLINKLEGN